MRNIAYLLFSFFLVSTHVFGAQQPGSGLCLTITPDVDSLWVCEGSSFGLSVSGGTDYSWSPAADFDDPNGTVVILTPSASQWYYVTGTGPDSTTVCTDSIYVSVNTAENMLEVQVSTTDTICPLDPVAVTFLSNGTIDSVKWNTTAGVEDPADVSGTTVRPRETTEYVVTAYLQGCVVMDTFRMITVNFRFDLVTEDTLYLCLGDSIRIRHNLLPAAAQVVWAPLDTTINVVMPSQADVFPTISTTYTATATLGQCVLSTTTFVRVDSLPDGNLVIVEYKDPYCAGEKVAIFAEFADTLKYPDIEFEWTPDDGQIQDSVNTGNVVIVVRDTTIFRRIMRNNACIDTSEVTLNTIPPDIPLSVMDTALCPGDMFQVVILDPDVTDIEWMPATGLSCTDCKNPTVTVQAQSIQYTVMAKKSQCAVSGMLNVVVNPMYTIPIQLSDNMACPGDEIQVTIDDTGLSNLNISVTGGSASCNNCSNPVITFGQGPVVINVTADESFENFCGAFGIAQINLNEDTATIASPETVCPNTATAIDLTAFGFVNPMLSLSPSGAGSLSCATCLNPEVTISQNATLIVISESQDPDKCGLRTEIPLFLDNGSDQASFTFGTDPPFGHGDLVEMTLVTIPPASSSNDYSWVVNGTTLNDNDATANVPVVEGENMIVVSWLNSNGCLQMYDTILIADPPGYRIPKAFTPGRSKNATFKVEITGNIILEELLVFNRWGQIVFEGEGDAEWDGRRNGEPAPPEVYVYQAKLRFADGSKRVEKGDVTLIR